MDEKEVIDILEVAHLTPQQAARVLRAAHALENPEAMDAYDRFILGGASFRLTARLRAYLERVARSELPFG